MNPKIKKGTAFGIVIIAILLYGTATWFINKKLSSDYVPENQNSLAVSIPVTPEPVPQATDTINSDIPVAENRTTPEKAVVAPDAKLPANEVAAVTKAPSVAPTQKIDCKLKFDDDVKGLDRDEVIVRWNCTNYTGWGCTLKNVQEKGSDKITAQLPSGEDKRFCWTPTHLDKYSYSRPTWYELKCTSKEGHIEKFEKIYRNFR